MEHPINIPQGGVNFGLSSAKDVQELQKALSVDYTMPPTTGANAIRAYSIDGTLRTVSYTQKHIKLWNRTNKVRAYSTVEEYVRLRNYGNLRAGAFVDAGALPPGQDSDYSRENKNVKYVGTTRAVQHQAMVVETVVVDDIISQEQVNGTIYLLGVIEKALFDADSSVVVQEWDGIITEIEREFKTDESSGIVIDLRGNAIRKTDLTKGSNVILNNYGIPTVMYTDLQTMGVINSLFYANQLVSTVDGTGIIGGVANQGFVYSPKQTFEYEPDVFLKPGEQPLTVKYSNDVPDAPTVSAAVTTDASSLFTETTAATYVVVAVNKYGESIGSEPATAAIDPGEIVTLTITKPAGVATVGYKIYRSDSAATPTLITRIAATGANQTYVDYNQDVPGTGKAVLIYEDITNFVFKQLVPFIKIPLAVVDASIRWMQLLYGTPILATPRKNVLFKNIKLDIDDSVLLEN